MQVTRHNISATKVQLTLIADQHMLDISKELTMRFAARDLKVPGFRKGKVPLAMVERHVDANRLQQYFLDLALNDLYQQAITQEDLRPVSQPSVTISKFVPYTTLEVDAEVEVLGDVTLMDYTQAHLAPPDVTVELDEIDAVLKQLQIREAERETVDRPAEKHDQVIVDFSGFDATTKEPIGGLEGKGYPVIIGTDSFIPTLGEQLIGLKSGEKKTFDFAFAEDYHISSLQNRLVTFEVNVQLVQDIKKSKLDDAFAEKIGEFKTLDALKADIKLQLEAEKQQAAERAYQEQLIKLVTDNSTVAIPDALIENELDRMDASERRDLKMRGQTWEEHLEAEALTEAERRQKNREQAADRVKAGIVLAEVAAVEHIFVSKDDVNQRLALLKSRYQDKQMRAELNNPKNRREISSQLLTEKVLAVLAERIPAKPTK